MILYKYMTSERLISLLETAKVRLTQFFDQNDPYECSIALLPLEREKEEALEDDYHAERIEVEAKFRREYSQFGMLCLTEHYNNLLMWSHYAENHRGAVVGFDTSNQFFNSREKLYEFTYGLSEKELNIRGFGTVKRMNYVTLRKHISLGDYYSLDDIFFTKSIHWQYEGEYRILKNIYMMKPTKRLQSGEEIYLTDIPRNCIKQIIFGLHCNEDLIGKASEIVQSNFSNGVKLDKAKLAHLTYDIDLKNLSVT
jgi:hypothetical protein